MIFLLILQDLPNLVKNFPNIKHLSLKIIDGPEWSENALKIHISENFEEDTFVHIKLKFLCVTKKPFELPKSDHEDNINEDFDHEAYMNVFYEFLDEGLEHHFDEILAD